MSFINKEEAISIMNERGAKKSPFVFLIDFNQEKVIIEDTNTDKLLYKVNDFKNYTEKDVNKDISIDVTDDIENNYRNSFSKLQNELHFGNTYLTNLTQEIKIKLNASLDEVFHKASAKYKFLFDNFVCFSPETFIQIKDGKIFTFPMKGTIDAGIKDAECHLLSNQKESNEHATTVDLLRNDLSMVSKNVRVEKYRYLDKIKSSNGKEYFQASSKIVGEFNSNYFENLGDIIFSLLPAGSISGAPKVKTYSIIKEIESYNRGFYTGVGGVFDGKNLDSCVLIRFIEKIGDSYVFKSGGGVTTQSEFGSEYKELIDKIYVPVS